MIKFFLLAILLSIYLFRFWQTTGCLNFVNLRFSPKNIKINVESQVGQDRTERRNLSRFFHNKITASIYEVLKSYSSVFEPRSLFEMLGPIGLLLVIVTVFNIAKSRKKLILWHTILIVLSPVLIILVLSPKIGFWLRSLVWYTFSLWGLIFFSKHWKAIIAFTFFIVLTFFYFSFSWQMKANCHEIFFN